MWLEIVLTAVVMSVISWIVISTLERWSNRLGEVGSGTATCEPPPLDVLRQTWTVDVPEGRGVPAGKYTILRGEVPAATGETDKE